MNQTRSKIPSKGLTPNYHGAVRVLGELQTVVMEILWSESPLSVLEVEQKLLKKREIAHTTVLTTLDRMHKKGLLLREKDGKAFFYSPRHSKEEFEHDVAQEVLSGLLSQFAEPALSAFIELVGEDGEKLDQLEELIRLKRKEINRETE